MRFIYYEAHVNDANGKKFELQMDNQMHLLCSNLEQTRKRVLIKFQSIREKSDLFKNIAMVQLIRIFLSLT